jgi:hypothetical protein
MTHYQNARNAELQQRTGIAPTPNPKGDVSHIHSIGRLINGMDESVQHNVPGNEKKSYHVNQGYKMFENALAKHAEGDHMGAISYATLASHHATELGRLMAPRTLEEAQDNYDPHIMAATSGGGDGYLQSYIDSVNESINKGK